MRCIAGVRQQEKEMHRLREQQQEQPERQLQLQPWWQQPRVITYQRSIFWDDWGEREKSGGQSVLDQLKSLFYESEPYLTTTQFLEFSDTFVDLLDKYLDDGRVDDAMSGAKNLMQTIRACVSEAKKAMGEQ
jgi:hypothetical protein